VETHHGLPGQASQVKPWPAWIDALIFCGSVIVLFYVGLIGFSGLPSLPMAQTIFRYGGTAVLIWLLLIGAASFLIGMLAARRLRRMRARWLPAVIGGAYSLAFVGLSMFVPLARGSTGSKALIAFLLLFPALALIAGALPLKRS